MSEPAGERPPLTPSQTVGPYLAIALLWQDGETVVPEGTPGAIRIAGRVTDGAGDPVPDGMVETWQADPGGWFAHPDDPRERTDGAGVSGFRGFGRSATGPDGEWSVLTLRPGSVPAADGTPQAPHLDVSVFARGMLDRVVTRIYFPQDEAALAADPTLRTVPAHRRSTLVAEATGDGGYRFDIRLQGDDETVFFDV
jgi:protocatechuate 3,4-dioxygenase alpha subunit